MAQNGRRRSQSGKRRAYDRAKDTPRRAQNAQRNRGTHQGYQEQTFSFETGGTPTRSRAGNSIEFPAQNTPGRPRRSPQGGQAQRGGTNGSPRTRVPAQNTRAGQANRRLRPTQANLQDPARREKSKQRRVTRAELRRRRIARKLTAFALLLCVIAAGVYLTVTMLFKINSIQLQLADGTPVSEAGGYSSDQILQALGVQLDENIFSFDPAEKASLLEQQFPLLEQIEVIRKYPTSVIVRVVEATPAWAMQTEGGWLTLSSTLKIIDEDSAKPALPTLYGGEPVSTRPGDQLAFAAQETASSSGSGSASASSEAAAAENRLEALNTLLTALNDRGLLADVTRIEFADTEQLAFLYQDRISVLLGTLNELDYKLDFAKYLLLNTDGKGCAPTDTGELDCSHVRTDGTLRPILAQGEPTLPSGYVVGSEETAVYDAAQPEETAAPDSTAQDETAAPDAAAQTETADATQAEATGG